MFGSDIHRCIKHLIEKFILFPIFDIEQNITFNALVLGSISDDMVMESRLPRKISIKRAY